MSFEGGDKRKGRCKPEAERETNAADVKIFDSKTEQLQSLIQTFNHCRLLAPSIFDSKTVDYTEILCGTEIVDVVYDARLLNYYTDTSLEM